MGANGSLTLNEQAKLMATPFLFSDQTMERLTEAERRGEYTLERLKKLRPEVIPEIIQLRGQWVGKLRIAKIIGVHHMTVSAVEAAPEYAEAIDLARGKRVALLRSAADKLVELVDEHPSSVPPQMRALAASQLLDKAELLDGRATQRVEHVEKLRFDDWESFIESQLPPENVIDIESVKVSDTAAADVSEVGCVIGSAAGKKSAIGDSEHELLIAALPKDGEDLS